MKYNQEIKLNYAGPRLKGYKRVDYKQWSTFMEEDFELIGEHLEGAPDEMQVGFMTC